MPEKMTVRNFGLYLMLVLSCYSFHSTSATECHTITTPMCTGLPYNTTVLPNSQGNNSQQEVSRALEKYLPLVNSGCSAHIRYFLCVLYIPVCTILGLPVPPCRSLCLTVKRDCQLWMNESLSEDWPKELECDDFPEYNLCVGRYSTNSEMTTDEEETVSEMTTDEEETEFKEQGNPVLIQMSRTVCERLEVPLCKNMPYKTVMLPNSFGDYFQQDIQDKIQTEYDFSHKSDNVLEYLCTLYAPMCTAHEKPIPPCRSLCIKSELEFWPTRRIDLKQEWRFDCDQFPEDGLCIPPNTIDTFKGISEDKLGGYDDNNHGGVSRNNRDKDLPSLYRCETLRVPFCKDIPSSSHKLLKGDFYYRSYNATILPNLLGHNSQNEIEMAMKKYIPVINSGCSPELVFLLCTLHTPLCTHVSIKPYPCKSLCVDVKSRCSSQMRKYLGVDWPDELQCKNDLGCITPVTCNSVYDSQICEISNSTFNTSLIPSTGDGNKINRDQDVRKKRLRCENLDVPLCKMSYNKTIMPNPLGHSFQNEIRNFLTRYSPVINSKCSKYFLPFLCTLLTNPCDDLREFLPPCRSMCIMSKRGCKREMIKLFGVKWPEELDCQQYPRGDKCVGEPKVQNQGNLKNIATDATKGRSPIPVHLIRRRCEDIEVPLCKSMPYSRTIMPNGAGHIFQNETQLVVNRYMPVINSGCCSHFAFLLCSIYTPVCTMLQKPVLPCKSVCIESKMRCKSQMRERLGVDWPQELDCHRFPDDGFCLEPDVLKTGSFEKLATLQGHYDVNGCQNNHNKAILEMADYDDSEISHLEKELNVDWTVYIKNVKDQDTVQEREYKHERCLQEQANCEKSCNIAVVNGFVFCCLEGKHVTYVHSLSREHKYNCYCV